MKTFALTAALTLGALPVAAQDNFAAQFTVSGALNATYEVSGTVFGLEPVGPGPNWMDAEAYIEGFNQGVNCYQATEFELDYYYGQENLFTHHILVTLVRGANGWEALEPAIFYDQELPGNHQLWETYDNARVQVDAFECVTPRNVRVALTFKAQLNGYDGAAPLAIGGTADATMPMFDMSQY